MRDLSYPELLQLIELVKSSTQFREFRFRSGELELELRRGPAPSSAAMPAATPAAPEPAPARPATAAAAAPAKAAPPAPPAAGAAGPAVPDGATLVRSPMVGTFYRAPEPGAAPFVEVGSRVEATTTVCIIEVMKLMNSMPAGCAGRVAAILVADGEPVEYGQPLVAIVAD